MHIQFFGACKTVTGSQHLITAGKSKILLECGFYQGRRQDMEEMNRNFPYNPADIDAVILSHAHIDHCGNLPNLVRQGFKGKIFCTHATKSLVAVMLEDSANIQLHDIKYLNKKTGKNLEPIYEPDDVGPTLDLLQGCDYNEAIQIAPGINAHFKDAGHVLGSALVTLEIEDESGRDTSTPHQSASVKIGFTGDLGRKFLPILRDPEQITGIDYLISESTYGDRLHEGAATSYKSLADAINTTYDRGGKIIIPSFALERAQELLYIIHELINTKKIPPLFVYVDSPLTVKISEIFSNYSNLVDKETKETFLSKNKNPFIFTTLRMIETVADSKKLNQIKDACIIISASGMCEFGRIRHHLKNNLGDARNTVIIVGFMAENTLGRRLLEGEKQVNILDEKINVKADIVVLNSLSAHADQNDLADFIEKASPLKKLFLVHGEEKAINTLKSKVSGGDIGEVVIPNKGDKFIL